MKTIATWLLLIIAVGLAVDNVRLYKELQALQTRENMRAYYRPNMTRDEMNVILFNLAGDSLAVMLPGDTGIYPYLIRPKPYYKSPGVKDY